MVIYVCIFYVVLCIFYVVHIVLRVSAASIDQNLSITKVRTVAALFISKFWAPYFRIWHSQYSINICQIRKCLVNLINQPQVFSILLT